MLRGKASLLHEGSLDSGTLTSATVARIYKEEKDGELVLKPFIGFQAWGGILVGNGIQNVS